VTTPPTYRIRARAQDLDITACTPVLMGCMQRFVISKDVAALREFHQLGIPLDYALDYAVQKGNMPLIEELLNNLGVAPSDTTLQRAMKRGLTIRNMFLDRVQPTVRHLNSAVLAEHFDIAHVLLDRNIQPDVQTVVTVKVSPRQSHERKQFVDRLIGCLDLRHLRHMPTLRKLPLITSVAQFERGLDQLVECTEQEREILLIECLRASALGHATAMIHRGAQFRADHMEIAGEGFVQPSDSNPRGLWEVRCAVVLEMAIEHGCLFQAAEDHTFSLDLSWKSLHSMRPRSSCSSANWLRLPAAQTYGLEWDSTS
jgi:hypothetical protein